MRKIAALVAAIIVGTVLVAGCSTKADTVNRNLDKEAESFKIVRKIQFVNGITDKVLVEIDGRCSIEYGSRKYDVTCKVDGGFIRNTITRSDNSFVVSQQLEAAAVSDTHYKILFRPGTVIPDVDQQ